MKRKPQTALSNGALCEEKHVTGTSYTALSNGALPAHLRALEADEPELASGLPCLEAEGVVFPVVERELRPLRVAAQLACTEELQQRLARKVQQPQVE